MNDSGQADQPASLNTLFKEISLIPHEAYLSIKNNKVDIYSKSHLDDLGYENNLKRFIEAWVSRIETLIVDGNMKIFTDITGGIDSRTVYALFMGALSRLNLKDSPNLFIKSGTADKYKDDLLSSIAIINRYKGRLNVKSHIKIPENEGVETYNKWQALSLGCYAPVYLPYRNIPNNIVYFGGGAGGMHRRVYNSKNLEEYIFRATKNISEKYVISEKYDLSHLIEEYTLQANSSLKEVKKYAYSGMNDLDILYREYRNRFHAGRGPQNSTIVAPLGSELLKAVSNYCDETILQRKQMYYDIMESLCPGLSIMPYDVPNKFPSYEVIKNISLIKIESQSNPGRVYKARISYDIDNEKKDSCYEAMKHMEEELKCFANGNYDSFFSDDYIKKALKVLDRAIIKKVFTSPREASSIHAILSYKMMCDFSSL